MGGGGNRTCRIILETEGNNAIIYFCFFSRQAGNTSGYFQLVCLMWNFFLAFTDGWFYGKMHIGVLHIG